MDTDLFKAEESKYGEKYNDHLLEQYKLYVELMDRVSGRRQLDNSFYVGINTALIGTIGFLFKDGATVSTGVFALISITGIIICYSWYRTVKSYKDLNTGKFKIIHAVEEKLPLALYAAEWKHLGKGKDKEIYLPLTHVEVWVPGIFITLYIVSFFVYLLSVQ